VILQNHTLGECLDLQWLSYNAALLDDLLSLNYIYLYDKASSLIAAFNTRLTNLPKDSSDVLSNDSSDSSDVLSNDSSRTGIDFLYSAVKYGGKIFEHTPTLFTLYFRDKRSCGKFAQQQASYDVLVTHIYSYLHLVNTLDYKFSARVYIIADRIVYDLINAVTISFDTKTVKLEEKNLLKCKCERWLSYNASMIDECLNLGYDYIFDKGSSIIADFNKRIGKLPFITNSDTFIAELPSKTELITNDIVEITIEKITIKGMKNFNMNITFDNK